MKKELSKYNATSQWWNHGKRTTDFSGNLFDLLKEKSITVRKVKDSKHPDLDCYVFTTCHRVTYKHFGFVSDGAFVALKLFYATMGDKATVNVSGKTFTINH